ncbi:MAG: Gfo/Idh/MocA family oxidoreductase [Planctomycetes bacterium]|nr:Gfo/Idh/MocA family oxidoreductase [Planctomycetota bacterium]
MPKINSNAPEVVIVGGGMITHDQILPSIYHLQRIGAVGKISVCALNNAPLHVLAESQAFKQAFPGQSFTPYPSFDEPADKMCPELFKEVISKLPPRQIVVVAVPDQFHYPFVKEALACNQHILCVKPLVLKYKQAVEIEGIAREKGLFVGVEYHKRFDRRALLAKKEYENGAFGEFIMGEARLLEPYLYRHSNFQNWFTCDQTDSFVYIGCHYVDQVYFITGLKPASISVSGVKLPFPNGKEGYLWANGRVIFENGAILSVTNGLGYPDQGGGSNDQGITLYFEGEGKTGMLEHDDQFRGVIHGTLEATGPGGTAYNYVNPDYFKLIPWVGEGYKPVGYGYDSVEANIDSIRRLENETAELSGDAGLDRRREILSEIDAKGLIATPANSSINELVQEAARLSILNNGDFADITYGDNPRVKLRK